MRNPNFADVKEREVIHRGLHEMCEHLYGDRDVGTPDEVTSLVDILVAIGEFTERQGMIVGQYLSHVIAMSVSRRES